MAEEGAVLAETTNEMIDTTNMTSIENKQEQEQQQQHDLESSEQPVINDDNDKLLTTTKNTKRRCIYRSIAVTIVSVVAVVVALLIWYFTTRPKNIPVVAAPLNSFSPPSLVKYGAIQGFKSGSVRIDSTSLFNTGTVRYWLTVSNDTQYPNNNSNNNITLALTKSSILSNMTYLTKPSSSALLIIPNIETQTFPLALPENFDPTPWKGVVFLMGDPLSNATIVGSVVWSYDSTLVKVGANGNGKNTTASNSSNVQQVNASTPASKPTSLFNRPPVTSPSTTSSPPTMSPGSTTTTVSPTSASPLLQLEAELCCSFTGRISLQYRVDIVNSVPTHVPYFLFENITVAGEPAPYLYLSHNPTGVSSLTAQDVELLIQGTDSTGSFTKTGTFTQDFPSTLTLAALPTFAGGSFIVWCTQYSVYLAGGTLVIR